MNQIDLDGRVAIVTGGARGIGYAVAEKYLMSGASVALWDMDAERLNTAVKELSAHGRVISCALDLTDDAAVNSATDEVMAAFDKIDILVNNAGITGGNGKLWDLEPDVWRNVIDANLTAPFLTCHAVVPKMIENGWGRIVNVASIAGKDGNPNASHYSASKAGLIGLTKSLGKELAKEGVLVNCITPAAARTEIFDQMAQEHIDFMLSKIPMERFLQVDEVAKMVAWLSSEDCSFSTGAVFDISGGRAVY